MVTYMRDVATVLQLRSLRTGALVRELPMPGYGSIKEMCGRSTLSQFYYSFQSMTDPGSTYLCALPTAWAAVLDRPDSRRCSGAGWQQPLCAHLTCTVPEDAIV